MLEVNRLEFGQPLDLIEELLDTGNAYLTCIDKDEFWGEKQLCLQWREPTGNHFDADS